VTKPISEELGFDWPPGEEERADSLELLQDTLRLVEEHDENYEARYVLVMTALGIAAYLGMEAGIRIDPAQPEWPVAYIELPTGQVSWHLPAHKTPYDGHSTPEKYERIKAWTGGEPA
jgi:hypothetical protein